MKKLLPRKQKDILNATKIIRDGRYRFGPYPNFEETENLKEYSLSTIGAPLFPNTKGYMELPGVNTFNIHSAYFPLF